MSISRLFSCLLISTALISPAHIALAEVTDPATAKTVEEAPQANEEKTEEATAAAVPATLPTAATTEMQATGLMSNQASGALPMNTLEQLGSEHIKATFDEMPVVQRSRLARQYLRRATLSNYDIPQDAPDFMEVRLNTMLRTGQLHEILDIYNRTPEAERPKYQYEISFTAMAALGRFSLVCLEKRVQSNDELKNSEALKDINLLCAKLLDADLDTSIPAAKVEEGPASPSPELQAIKAMRAPSLVAASKMFLKEKGEDKATPLAAIGKLDLITLQAKNIAGLIAYPATNVTAQYRQLPVSHMAVLLAVPPEGNEENRFALYSAALERGLFTMADMGKAYKVFAAERKGKTITADMRPWEKLVLWNSRIQNTPSTTTQVSTMNEMLAIMPVVEAQYGLLAAAPFLTEFRGLSKDMNLTATQARYFLRMLLLTNQNDEIFGDLAQKALSLGKKPEDAFELATLWNEKLTPAPKSDEKAPEAKEEAKTSEKTEATATLSKEQKILTVLTAKNDADEIKKVTYEKLIALTPPADYVMPSHEVWERARQAYDKKQAGMAVLITPLILRDQSLAATPPELLSFLIGTYKTVGYEQEAHQMLAERLAGLIAELKQ